MFTIQFATANAAFGEDSTGAAVEVAAILEKVARTVLNGETSGRVWDTNGNAVGSWALTAEDPS